MNKTYKLLKNNGFHPYKNIKNMNVLVRLYRCYSWEMLFWDYIPIYKTRKRRKK